MLLAVTAGMAPPTRAGDWVITPRVEGQEIFTDNVFATPNHTRSDFITRLAPGININGESSRLRAQLDYSPSLYVYALTPSQDVLGHDLNANATATLVPNLLYFDANAFAALEPTTPALTTDLSSVAPITGVGAIGPGVNALSPALLPKNQLSQVSTFIASPYLQRRFGTYGVGELRYTLTNDNFGGGQNLLLPGSGTQSASDLTHEATATFATGEYFDRFAANLLLDSSRSSGAGVLNNAAQDRAIVAGAFPLVGKLAALTTLGYENLRFHGEPPFHVEDPVWGVGARFAPAPNRTVLALYGHHDGFTSPYFALDYALTPLTRVTASYTDGLSTTSEDIARNLVQSQRINGQTVDAHTLLPLTIHNPLLGLQLSLFRTKVFSGNGYLDYKRDHFSIGALHEEDLVVAQAPQPQLGGVSLRSTTADLGWAHDLNPRANTQVAFGYSWVTLLQAPQVKEKILTAGASLNYSFNPTLVGSASYTYFSRDANQPAFSATANIVSVSLRKTF